MVYFVNFFLREISPLLSLSKVNWVPLLTRDVVDDFASHLRLYRKAKERMLLLQKEPRGPADDLESLFFDLELEMEKSYCRDLVSSSPAYESGKLNHFQYH
jgi:sorting nexin-13